MQRGGLVAIGFMAACSTPPSQETASGTLAYVEAGTGALRLLDLETRAATSIDGTDGRVTIAPDGQHVGFATGRKLFVADRTGATVPLAPDGKDYATVEWLSNDALAYITDGGLAFVPALGGPARVVPAASGYVVGDELAYAEADGDVVIEHRDGTGARVVLPSSNPTAMYPARAPLAFSPDGSRLVVFDVATATPQIILLPTSDSGDSIVLTDVRPLGGPFGSPRFLGASAFSPDGRELLLQSPAALVAVDVATGATRTIAPFDANVTCDGAVFLDADRVLWIRDEDRSIDDQGFFVDSLHVVGPGGDTVIADPQQQNFTWRSIAVHPDGSVIVPATSTEEFLGITPEGGVIAVDTDGVVRLRTDDDAIDVVRASVDVEMPIAAYAPR